MEGKITHSKRGGYYSLTVNGEFVGNYDTFKEATDEYVAMCEEEAKEVQMA